MSCIVLLGAGFSHNWGAPLAAEVMGDVLGRIGEDRDLSSLVRSFPNFEDALALVHRQFDNRNDATRRNLDRMQAAVLDTFQAINQAFVGRGHMEFSQDVRDSIQTFLSRFDAIFTLNQDLLFELFYNIELCRIGRWNGHHFPGMRPERDFRNTPIYERIDVKWRPLESYRREKNLQPIFKLHGSADWRDAAAGDLLVLGADKEGIIRQRNILSWYMEQFRQFLEQANTRVMVIGYGFRDEHVNDVIHEAWQRSGLRMFLVNPRGRRVLERQQPNQIKVPDRMEQIGLIGESTRPLSSTFNGDHFERGKLERFFDD